jgi:hypothetical protein
LSGGPSARTSARESRALIDERPPERHFDSLVAFGAVADALFEDPHLAVLYDPLDPDRRDLDAYAAMVTEFGASSVLDVGCGTWQSSAFQ